MPVGKTDPSTQMSNDRAAISQDPWNRQDFVGSSSSPALSSVRPSRWHGTVGLHRCLWIVLLASLVTNGLSLAASQLWIYPDSVDYIQLAGGIADRFDFHNELYLIRTPGYPIFLAVIFKIFGSSSPMAILILQHLMVVVIALLASMIAHQLTNRLCVRMATGLFCAGSLQLLSYANLLLTETSFTLAVITYVYFIIRYHREGGTRHLILSSLCIEFAGHLKMMKSIHAE